MQAANEMVERVHVGEHCKAVEFHQVVDVAHVEMFAMGIVGFQVHLFGAEFRTPPRQLGCGKLFTHVQNAQFEPHQPAAPRPKRFFQF